MKKTILSFLLIFNLSLFSQDYFQQEVNHKIDVFLNDVNHTLIAQQTIEYTNNSPNDLDVLWFHIWPNAYKNNSTALVKHELDNGNTELWYAEEDERGYISDLNFTINGKKVEWKFHPDHIDICKLILNKPIRAGESITIKTPFKVKIPNAKFSRLGHVEQSYMITQWYPKPAVYDQDGWHIMTYLSQGEFYSEFGSFNVSITLPMNYTIGSTGDLQNIEEKIRLDSIEKLLKKKIEFNSDMSFPKSDDNTKTLHFNQENVHDFAWFADKRYHVLKGSVKLPFSEKIVDLYTMFTNNEAHLWKESIEYMRDAVYYYSLWNGDYPYNHCTAVDGTIAAGGGMEYPNVTVIGESGNSRALETVIMHEVGHNWFYGILGNNERDHAWMDEGINSYYEHRYMRTKYPNQKIIDNIPKSLAKIFDLEEVTDKNIMGELLYFINASTAKDQPINLNSKDYTPLNYGGIVYMKTAVCFEYLSSYLGQELFDECMKEYFETWKYKHPKPKDLQKIFEDKTSKDLSWFFNNMITTTNQLDYSISKIEKEPTELHITLKNNGSIPGPLIINGVTDGKISDEIWVDGFKNSKKITFLNDEFDHIRIDYFGVMPEVNRNNNIIRTKGLFKQCEPLKLQLIGSLYHPEKTQIFYHPQLTWNKYNKYSVGLSIYNTFIPKGDFSFKLSPMYSFGTETLVGRGNFAMTKYSHSSIFSKIKLFFDIEQFNYNSEYTYQKINPGLDLILNNKNLRSKKESSLNINYNFIFKDGISRELDSGFEPGIHHIEENKKFINLNYSFRNDRTINPYNYNFNIENAKDFVKYNLEFNYTYQINKNKKLNTRLYTGISKINAGHDKYSLQMSAWNGSMDYSFSEKTFSRENLGDLSKQIFVREGGLKHRTDIVSDNLLMSLSTNYNIYKFLNIYSEFGYANKNDFTASKIAFGSGCLLKLNGIQIFLPIITENGIFNNQRFDESFRISINKEINFNKLIF